MTRSNTILPLVSIAIGILSSPAARGASVEDLCATFVWEPAGGPVAGYGVWVTWDGVPGGSEPDQVVTEPAGTIVGSPGQVLSIHVAAFDQEGNWGPPSPVSDEVLLAPPPPVSTVAVEGDVRLSDALSELAGSGSQLSMRMTGSDKQLLDVSPEESLLTDEGWFGVDQLVVGAAGNPSAVRLLEAANLELAQGVGELYLFGLGYGERCARNGEEGLRIHEGSTLILGGLDLYVFDGVECVYINDLFPAAGGDPDAISYDEGEIRLYGDLDEDGVRDPDDNCLLAMNRDQRDVDADGYGDRCDADYNQDGLVNDADLQIFKASFFSRAGEARYRAEVDHDGNGLVLSSDFNVFGRLKGGAPGPSGLSCAGTTPCY